MLKAVVRAFGVSGKLLKLVAPLKPGDGVVPGKYAVTIQAYSKYPPDPKSATIPAKYLDPKTSGFEADIQKATNDLKFELDKQ